MIIQPYLPNGKSNEHGSWVSHDDGAGAFFGAENDRKMLRVDLKYQLQ